MVTGDRIEITIGGGAPWGFRLQGGGQFPLEVAKIRKKSRADDADLREGDIVSSINGSPISGKSHGNAMDIVELAGDSINMVVIRPASGPPANRPQDPQRIQRPAPSTEVTQGLPANRRDPSPGVTTRTETSYSSTEGNIRHAVRKEESVVQAADGSTVTRHVTESRLSTVAGTGTAPPAQREGRSLSKSPNIPMWKPKSLSPVPNQRNVQSETQTSSKQTSSKQTLVWQPPTKTAVPARAESPYRSHTLPKPKKRASLVNTKENVDPVLVSEQAKWEARQGPADVPVFRLDNFGSRRAQPPDSKPFIPPPKDPRYPMFEPPKTDWAPPQKPTETRKQPPPVAPKPPIQTPSSIPFQPLQPDINPNAGSDVHHPGMIPPPPQLSAEFRPGDTLGTPLIPAPPPPPMPPSPGDANIPSMPKRVRPGQTSTPLAKHYHDDTDAGHHEHPDHPHIFGPQVYMTPQDDSGVPGTPEQDHAPGTPGFLMDDAHKKLFSDSAFYDEPSSRYPTINEQMSMCKQIAQSLTSAANRRAKGARMFLKRRHKSTKWIHEGQFFGYSSEYSSSGGDVADLNDLDSEFFVGEGGSRPLFSFRIPKIAGQATEGQKMSLSKDEFERLRLGATKCDHQAISPNMCFNIAADLHKGGKNRGAKLFQKRQQRVEKYVIDESNVIKPPQQTKLDLILQSPPSKPQPSPWEAAQDGDMNSAFSKIDNRHTMQQNLRPLGPLPRHKLENDSQFQLLEGADFNRKARGWGGHPDAPHNAAEHRASSAQSHGSSSFRQETSTSSTTFPRSMTSPTEADDYNRRIKGWGDSPQTVTTKRSMHMYNEQYFPVPKAERGQCDL